MGLDMYAYARDNHGARENEEIMVWRKHPNLHGWMEQLYRDKGGEGTFNCIPVELTARDLNKLEDAVLANKLPQTEGFFFGASRPEDKVRDLTFINKAREALKQGKQVFYSSWW